jgi:hypothetical protein
MNEKSEPLDNILRIEMYKAGEFLGYKWASTPDLPELQDINVKNIDKFDWSAFYTCLDFETAEGYLVNRLPDDGKGNGTVYMHKIFLTKDVRVIVCKDIGFQDGSYKDNGTVSKIKKELRASHEIKIEDEDPLLPTLGKNNYVFRCFHDKDGTEELVIPHILKPEFLRYEVIQKYEFKFYRVIKKENLNSTLK